MDSVMKCWEGLTGYRGAWSNGSGMKCYEVQLGLGIHGYSSTVG